LGAGGGVFSTGWALPRPRKGTPEVPLADPQLGFQHVQKGPREVPAGVGAPRI